MSCYSKKVTKGITQLVVKLGYPEVFSLNPKISDSDLYPTYGQVLDYITNKYDCEISISVPDYKLTILNKDGSIRFQSSAKNDSYNRAIYQLLTTIKKL